jgi:hypothetical protein
MSLKLDPHGEGKTLIEFDARIIMRVCHRDLGRVFPEEPSEVHH